MEFVKIVPVSLSVRRRKSTRKSSTGDFLEPDMHKDNKNENFMQDANSEDDVKDHSSSERSKNLEECCEESSIICDSFKKKTSPDEKVVVNDCSLIVNSVSGKSSTRDIPTDPQDTEEIIQSSQNQENDDSSCGKVVNRLFSPRFSFGATNSKPNTSHESKTESSCNVNLPKSCPSESAPAIFEGEVKETEMFMQSISSLEKLEDVVTVPPSVNGYISTQIESSEQLDTNSHHENTRDILEKHSCCLKTVNSMCDYNSQLSENNVHVSDHKDTIVVNEEAEKANEGQASIDVEIFKNNEERKENMCTTHENGVESTSNELFSCATVSSASSNGCKSNTVKDTEPSAKICETPKSDQNANDTKENKTLFNDTPFSGKQKLLDEEENSLSCESSAKKRKKQHRAIPHQKMTRQRRNAESSADAKNSETIENSLSVRKDVVENSLEESTEVSSMAIAESDVCEDGESVPTELPLSNAALSHDLFAADVPLTSVPAVVHITTPSCKVLHSSDHQVNEHCEDDSMEDISMNAIEDIPNITCKQKVVGEGKTAKKMVSQARESVKAKKPVRKHSPAPVMGSRNLRSGSKHLSLEPVKSFKSFTRSRRSLASADEFEILQNSLDSTKAGKSNKHLLKSELSEKDKPYLFDSPSAYINGKNTIKEECLDISNKTPSPIMVYSAGVSKMSVVKNSSTDLSEKQLQNVCTLESRVQDEIENSAVPVLCALSTSKSLEKEMSPSGCEELGDSNADQKVMSSPCTLLLAALSGNNDSPVLPNDHLGSPLSNPCTVIHGKCLTYTDLPVSPITGILKRKHSGEKRDNVSPVKKKVRFSNPLVVGKSVVRKSVVRKSINSGTRRRRRRKKAVRKSKHFTIVHLPAPLLEDISKVKTLDASNPISVCPFLVNSNEPLKDILPYVILPSDLDNISTLTSQHNVKTIGDLCKLSNKLLQTKFQSYLDYDTVYKIIEYWVLQSQSSIFSHFSICEVSSSNSEGKIVCCTSDKCETCVTLRKENEKNAASSENSNKCVVEVLPKETAEGNDKCIDDITAKSKSKASKKCQNKESEMEKSTIFGRATYDNTDLIDSLLGSNDDDDYISPLTLLFECRIKWGWR